MRERTDSYSRRRWVIPEPHEVPPIEGTPYPEFVTRLLRRRGVTDAEAARAFLFEPPPRLPDALDLPGAVAAIDRIAAAVQAGEAIAVYGDFDVDGVTATAILTEAIRAAGGHVTPYVPDRFTEGYGLHVDTLARLRAEHGIALLITADCGITAIPEVAAARALGMDVIILDHHATPEQLPDATAIINPKLPDSRYPFAELSSGGVAYRLAGPLLARFGVAVDPDQWLDLATLSTIADVMPLVAENRWIVHAGLQALRTTPRAGLRALLEVAGLGDAPLEADDVAFALAPRLNAAGRLDHARLALELLLEHEPARAQERAAHLDRLNLERRRMTTAAMAIATARLAEQPEAPLIMLGDAAIPAGIVGLVAGRLAEQHYRPVVVYEERADGTAGASCRSIPEFDIAAALHGCGEDQFLKMGGHAAAAGFTARLEALPTIRERLVRQAGEQLAGVRLQPRLEIDAQVPLERLGAAQVAWLQRLAPFGAGNRAPTFVSTNVVIDEFRTMGVDGAHARFALRAGTARWTGVGFGLGGVPCRAGDRVDVAWTLKRNALRGTVELEVKDLAPAGGGREAGPGA